MSGFNSNDPLFTDIPFKQATIVKGGFTVTAQL